MGPLAFLLYWLIRVYTWALIGRLVLDLVVSINRGWRPGKLLLPIAEIVMTITDPPLRLMRRIIPTIRLGRFVLDLSWILLIFLLDLLKSLVLTLPF